MSELEGEGWILAPSLLLSLFLVVMEGDGGGGGGAGIERREKDKGNEREKISLYIFGGEILSDFWAGGAVHQDWLYIQKYPCRE